MRPLTRGSERCRSGFLLQSYRKDGRSREESEARDDVGEMEVLGSLERQADRQREGRGAVEKVHSDVERDLESLFPEAAD